MLGDWGIDANGDTTLTTLSGYQVLGGDFVSAGLLSASP